MKIAWEKNQRDIAKAQKKSLYAMAITHPGGKPAITVAGPCNADETKEVTDFILGFIERRSARLAKEKRAAALSTKGME